jgi:hypothetical protein
LGNTFSLGGTTVPVRDPDVAANPINNTYMQVSGNGFIEAHLVSATGTLINRVRVSNSEYAAAPRIAFSPDVQVGGGYLVTWHASIGSFARVRGRIISAAGAWVTGEFDIAINAVDIFTSTNWTMGAAVAYSTVSREFLVAWMGSYNVSNDIYFARVSNGGVLQANAGVAFNTQVTSTTPDWERDPAVAYNPDTDEFYIAYGGYVNAGGYGFTGGRRVKAGSGAFVGQPQQFGQAAAIYVPAVTYNTIARQYLLGWYHRSSQSAAVYGMVLNGADASPVGDLRVLSAYYFAYDALDIDYNAPSGQYLLTTYSRTWEDAAVTILSNGVPYDNGFVATNTTDVRPIGTNVSGEGNFSPRMASSGTEKKWLLVTSNKFSAVYGQFLATNANPGDVVPPPPLPPLGGGGGGGGTTCAYALNDTSASVPGAGYTGALAVSTTAGCAWSVASGDSWLTVSTSSGSGPGGFQWTAAPNATGNPRSGTITVAGRTFTANQISMPAVLADFNADANVDIIWQNQATGNLAIWRMAGFNRIAGEALSPSVVADTGWKIVAAMDVDRDGATDLVWQHDAGWLAIWKMRGETMVSGDLITTSPLSDTAWHVVGSGDLDGDGWSDLIWQHQDGRVAAWYMRGTTMRFGAVIAQPLSDQGWRVVGAADMNRDGKLDLVWHHNTSGRVAVWLMNRTILQDAVLLSEAGAPSEWHVRGIGDFDRDGDVDLLWQNVITGAIASWVMNGMTVQNGLLLPHGVPDTSWTIVAPR